MRHLILVHFNAKPIVEDYIQFTYSELTTGRFLGRGTFGVVQEVNVKLPPSREKQMKVAVKLFKGSNHPNAQLTEILKQFRNEIVISKRLEAHPNIVKFIGACLEYPNLCLVLEYLPLGDLLSWMRDSKKKLSKDLMFRFISDLVTGLSHIHRLGIIHRDCKSSNCLVASTDPRDSVTLKIGDFGLSRYMAKSTSPDAVLKASLQVGTIQWTGNFQKKKKRKSSE